MARQRTAEGRMPDHTEAGTPGVDEAPVDPGTNQPSDGENRGELVGDGGSKTRAPAPVYEVRGGTRPEHQSFRKGGVGGGRGSQWPRLLNEANEARLRGEGNDFHLGTYNTKNGAQNAAKELRKRGDLPTFDGVTMEFSGIRTGEQETQLWVEFKEA